MNHSQKSIHVQRMLFFFFVITGDIGDRPFVLSIQNHSLTLRL